MMNLIIKNGRIVDGTGNASYYGDVGIFNGKIAGIGNLSRTTAEKIINADGLAVAPGFVDIHSHADFIIPLPDHAGILEPLLLQGITTLVTGNCGLSPAPVNPEHLELLKSYTRFFQGGELSWDWTTMKEYLEKLAKKGVGFNVIPLVSHGAVRIAVMGFEIGPPSSEQLSSMKELVAQSLENGAFGLSAGLIYAPGMYASTDELIEISKPLIPHRAVFTCHVRGSSETGISSTKEIIEIARQNGIPVEHSHIEEFGEPYWEKIDEVIALHQEAREEGLDLTFDVIPYTAANTTLTACFPPYAFEGGIERFIEKLKDHKERQRLRFDIENMASEWPTWRPGTWPHNLVRATGWKNIWLLWVPGKKNSRFQGKNFEEIGQTRGETPFDAACDILIEEKGAALALFVGVSGDLENDEGLKKFLICPDGAINTDAILTGRGLPHPAAYGAFPRVLGQYVREQKLMRLEEAVRKMTSLPLNRFSIHDRGLIKPGMCADITIFNPDTVRDNATYMKPVSPPTGIEFVFINGKVAVEHGRPVKEVLAGSVLSRSNQ